MSIVSSIINFIPSQNFLVDITTFESVIIGVAIPLSFEIVSRISEKYHSEVISKHFMQNWEIKLLPIFLIINNILAITLRFYIPIKPEGIIWKILAWITFVGFLINTTIFLFKFLPKLKHYMTDINFILEGSFNEAEKLITNKELKLMNERFNQSLESIGDILVIETKWRNRNENVIRGLTKIKGIIDQFLTLQKNNSKKKSSLTFNQDKYRMSFSITINQIIRIYEAAIKIKNDEISCFTTDDILKKLLSNFSKTPNNDLFIEQLLKCLMEIEKIAIENDDRFLYNSSIHWYVDIVFNEKDFNCSYLELFNLYFITSVKYIISKNHFSLFIGLVSSLIDGFVCIPRVMVCNYVQPLFKNLHKYNQLNTTYNIKKRVKELSDSENDLNTQKKLNAWLKKFDELKKIIEQNIDKEQEKNAKYVEENIKDFVICQFKYQNLLEIVFIIGAYCLFKQRYGYIKYLWEYKQPPDSDVIWIGHDIIPQKLDDIINLYLFNRFFDKKIDFWKNHHISEKYYKQYFLLLLANILQNVPADAEGNYSLISNYKLPNLDIYKLDDLKHSIDEYIKLVKDLKENRSMLVEIGFDTTKLDDIFDAKLVFFLKKMKKEISFQISNKHKKGKISETKVVDFKKKVLKSFYDTAILRDIFIKYFKTYENKTIEKIPNKKERLEIYCIEDKASFFDEWYIHYNSWGDNCGREIAYKEDIYLFDELVKACKEIFDKDLEISLSKFENSKDIVIFTINNSFNSFLGKFKKFKIASLDDIKQVGVKGFFGWYNFNGQEIPIFNIVHPKIDKQILILNKSKIGQLIQLSPVNEGDDAKLIEDIFFINIQAFSENKKLMEEYIKKPPKWLQKVGDENKQLEYLQERVHIQIFERFEYNKSGNFEGYKVYFYE